MSILNQPNKIPQAIISNGQVTGNPVQNPNNLLNTTDNTAIFSQTSDVILGNFPFSIPQGAVIVGISGVLKARIDSNSIPSGSITPILVDGISFYPTTPIIGLSDVLQEYSFGGAFDLWGNFTLTADKLNNIKLQLTANSSIEVAWVSLTVFYYIPVVSPTPTPFLVGCSDCDSEIQALPFQLAQPWLSNSTKLVLKSFSLPNGTPIDLDMLGACGGTINLTIDPDKSREDGGNFIENFNIDASIASISYLPNGYVEIDLGDIQQRGLDFVTPYGHVPSNISEHSVGAVVIITNNGPYNSKLLKRCHIGSIVSAPIETLQENVSKVYPTTKFNFLGGGVVVSPDPIDPEKANINIAGSGTVPPQVFGNGGGSSGNTQVNVLNYTVEAGGVDRGCLVRISTEEIASVVSVTASGIPLTQIVSETDAVNNLRSEIWFLTAPPTGVLNIEINLSQPAYICSGATTLVGVNQATAIGNIAQNSDTSNNPNTTLTTIKDYSIVFDSIVTAQTPIFYTPGFSQILDWSFTSNQDIRQGGGSNKSAGTSPDTVLMEWSITQNTNWCITAIEIQGITSGGGSDELVKVDSNDANAGYLDSKINIQSTDNTVSVTKTILNIGGNESIEYELSTNISYSYLFDDTVGGNPSIGFITYNDATPANVTQVNINNQDGNGNVIAAQLNSLLPGDSIILTSVGSPGKFAVYQVVSTNNTGAVTEITATYVNSASTFNNNESISLSFVQGGGGLNSVANVGTGQGEVFKNITGNTVNLKTIKAGTNVTITNNTDDITISATGDVNTLNVTLFEDFIFTLSQSTFHSSLYFIKNTTGNPSIAPVADHPGIWRISNGDTVNGFIRTIGTGNLVITNDFDITALVRYIYSGSGLRQAFFTLISDSGNNVVDIFTELSSGPNFFYSINGGSPVDSGVPVPASGSWTKLRMEYVGGILTLYQDSNILFSGPVSFITGASNIPARVVFSVPTANISLDVDYVIANYTVNR